jgi:hypothetical protein
MPVSVLSALDACGIKWTTLYRECLTLFILFVSIFFLETIDRDVGFELFFYGQFTKFYPEKFARPRRKSEKFKPKVRTEIFSLSLLVRNSRVKLNLG